MIEENSCFGLLQLRFMFWHLGSLNDLEITGNISSQSQSCVIILKDKKKEAFLLPMNF